MLSQKPNDPDTTAPDAAPAVPAGADPMQTIQDLLASPEFQNLKSFESSPLFDDSTSPTASPLFDDAAAFDVDAFLTSPLETPYDDFTTSPAEDSPFSDFLTTPVLPMASEADMLTGPLIEDVGYSAGMDLFGGVPAFPTYEVSSAPKLPTTTTELYTISPGTPALDSLDPATTVFPPKPKNATPAASPADEPKRRRSTATGTRKNLKPESLVPMDAPTQKRSYVTPSATSRKAVPAAFAQKKRLHSAAFDAEEEELGTLSPTASEQEAIEYKRRQNTLAARKSRKRKLEHQNLLEQTVETLTTDRDRWKTKALLAQELLKANGIAFDCDDE